jgi:hypothetical protein
MKFTISAGEVFRGCCVAVTVGRRNGMQRPYATIEARQSAARGHP